MLLNENKALAMSYARTVIATMLIGFAINNIAFAQLIERTDEGALRFTDQIVGKWEIDNVVAAGRSASANYGPSVFTASTWAIQTKNGDIVYELSSVNESADPLEATFVNVKHRDSSFAAFIRLEGEKLSIIRGLGPKNPIPLPEKMEEGPSTLVYSLKKAASSETSTREERLPLNVRLIDESSQSRVLVDVILKPFFGGKLRYSSKGLGARAEQDYSPKTGTVIIGTLEPTGDGNWAVSLIIEIGAHEKSDDPQTAIVRSEKLQLTTVVTREKTIRINCGADRTCELMLK